MNEGGLNGSGIHMDMDAAFEKDSHFLSLPAGRDAHWSLSDLGLFRFFFIFRSKSYV